MKKLRVGLIGLGGVAQAHLEAYKEVDRIEVVAGAEVREDRLQQMVKRWGIKGYTGYEEMLSKEDLNIACILTPPLSHQEITEKIADYGVHVLCEKPMALTLEGAQAMISACDQAGVKFYYGSVYRSMPACMNAKEMIDNEVLGNIHLMLEIYVGGGGPQNWHDLGPHHYPTGGPGGGGMGLVDHGIHLVDIFQWFLASGVASVFGRGNYSGKTPGTEFLTMMFPNGAIGQLIYNEVTYPSTMPYEGIFSLGASWGTNGELLPGGKWDPQPGSIHVHGEKGSLRIFHYVNKLFFFGEGRQEQIPVLDRPSPGHFALQMESFASSIIHDRDPAVTGLDGLKALQIILAAYESYEQNSVITISDTVPKRKNISLRKNNSSDS